MADPVEIHASFEFTRRQKHDLEQRAKAIDGDRIPFGKLWQDFLDGGSVGETVMLWWWATQDGHPDVTIDDVLDWDADAYEIVLPDIDEEEGPGEGNAAGTGGSTTSARSSRSSSSTDAAEKKSSTGTTTSSEQPSTT